MKKTILRMLALVLAMMMVLSACGNATPTETTQATNAPETSGPSGVIDDKPPATQATNPPTDPPKDPAPHEAHCLCGGKAVAVGTHTECKTEETWTLLTQEHLQDCDGGFKIKESGNYYLGDEFKISAPINIFPDQTITLCLNGQTLTGKTRLFRVNGVLNLCDCEETGKTLSTTTGIVGTTYIYSGGTFNLYSGTLDGGGIQRQQGGIVAIAGNDIGNHTQAQLTATFNMFGGKITGGNVKCFEKDGKYSGGVGANVVMWHYCVFNMYGGTIENGKGYAEGDRQAMGANIYANGSMGISEVNLMGGTITGGYLDDGNQGAGIYVGKTTKLTISGNVNITGNQGGNIYLHPESTGITFGELGPDAKLSFTLGGERTEIASGLTTDISAYIASDDENKVVSYVDGVLSLVPKTAG